MERSKYDVQTTVATAHTLQHMPQYDRLHVAHLYAFAIRTPSTSTTPNAASPNQRILVARLQNATTVIETSGDQHVACEAYAGSLTSATAVSAQASAVANMFEGMCSLRLDAKPLTDYVSRISVAIASVRFCWACSETLRMQAEVDHRIC